jgi:hypothetical protein
MEEKTYDELLSDIGQNFNHLCTLLGQRLESLWEGLVSFWSGWYRAMSSFVVISPGDDIGFEELAARLHMTTSELSQIAQSLSRAVAGQEPPHDDGQTAMAVYPGEHDE